MILFYVWVVFRIVVLACLSSGGDLCLLLSFIRFLCFVCAYFVLWGFVSVLTLFDCGGEGIAFETGSVDPYCRLNQEFISVPESKEVGL